MIEVGLHEVMAMAEGMMFRFEKSGDRYAPPGCAMQPCSIMERLMWYQIHIRQDSNGKQKACVSLRMRHEENSPSWELWVGDDCRWNGRLFSGGRTILEDEWKIDEAISRAVDTRNAGLR